MYVAKLHLHTIFPGKYSETDGLRLRKVRETIRSGAVDTELSVGVLVQEQSMNDFSRVVVRSSPNYDPFFVWLLQRVNLHSTVELRTEIFLCSRFPPSYEKNWEQSAQVKAQDLRASSYYRFRVVNSLL